MNNTLFSPLTITAPSGNGLTLRNRTILSPMCQYTVDRQDGVATDWHLQHYGAMAAGGFGMLTVESTAVNAQGRISPRDLGLYTDEQQDAHARLVDFAHRQGAKMAVQLNHAGFRASGQPWLPGFPRGSASAEEGGWQSVSVSEDPLNEHYHAAKALDEKGLSDIVSDFAAAARRADAAGYDAIEIHAAHGYLLHESLSPLSNRRTDEYGGDEAGRTRLVTEVVDAVRAAWPDSKPLGIRISATDWVEGGWTLDASIRLLGELVAHHGITWVDVSSGSLVRTDSQPSGPGFHVPLASKISRALGNTDATVSVVGGISSAAQAETIVRSGQADAVDIGRAALRDPHWPSHAAAELGVGADGIPCAPSYWRAQWRA